MQRARGALQAEVPPGDSALFLVGGTSLPPSKAAPSVGVSDRSVPVADQGGSDQQISAVGATAAAALAPSGVSFDVDDLLSWAAGAQAAGMGRAG